MTTDIANVAIAIGTGFAALAGFSGVFLAYKVHNSQKLLAQRQLLLPLWQYMSNLSDINPEQPITPDVIKAINTLELVALCCEGDLIDAQIIRRTFREEFMKHYQAIKHCEMLPGLNVNGEQLLTQNRAASAFFDALLREHLDRDGIKPLQ